MKKKLLMLTLALGAAAASGLFTASQAEAACRKVCCPNDPTLCIECCNRPCPVLRCPA